MLVAGQSVIFFNNTDVLVKKGEKPGKGIKIVHGTVQDWEMKPASTSKVLLDSGSIIFMPDRLLFPAPGADRLEVDEESQIPF